MRHVNALECCDFYKTGHRQQYPAGTELVVSNLTPRSGRHANVGNKSGIIFYGLQYFIIDYLIDRYKSSFFDLPKELAVKEYKELMDESLGSGAIPVDHIEALHDLGYLPIEIRAVPEGTFVPVRVPCVTIHNTLPQFFWLPNYLETVLSSYVWMPSTSATTAKNYRILIDEYINKTGSPAWFADWQCHDFSFRGMSSLESAIVSGSAHLTSFTGTDTVPAIRFLKKYYGATTALGPIGGSVPATEHSVMSMDGESGELETFRRLITKTYPQGIVSIVSDTWDFWQVITEYSKTLHQEIMSRVGKVVFRPDSGDPADIICGTTNLQSDDFAPQMKGAVQCLWEIFGGTFTETGHKLLDSHVGLIYGDSITYDVAKDILARLDKKGFASANIVFGIGSFTYQYTTRDTWGFAVKATFGRVNGEDRNIYKKPKTDNGEKNSAKGLLFVDDKLNLTQGVSWDTFNSPANLLQPVFRDGQLLRQETLADIRKRIHGIDTDKECAASAA